ncbi:MAG: hypothetical protein K2N67_01445 [Mucispirillum sp.]|nr:hypothetical protein [Mucispirillum sp.]
MNKLYKYSGTGNNGLMSWALQRISAVVLLFALGYHILGKVMSKTSGDSIIDGQSNTFLLSTMWFFVTFHVFNGLKMVTDDYVSGKVLRFILYAIYWVLAIIMLKLSFGLM